MKLEGAMKPEPMFRIAANASCRNPKNWYAPNSLCRTCVYQFLQEPYCNRVEKITEFGVIACVGYEKETMLYPEGVMGWTSEDRLKIIKALMVLGPENETWEEFNERIMFLCDMPDEFLEANRDKYAKAIRICQVDVTIEI